MRLYVMSTGEILLDKGAVLTPGVDDGRRVKVPVPVYLLQTDDGKNIMIDTGLHPEHIEDPDATTRPRGPEAMNRMIPFMREEDRIEHQLARIGISIGDVDYLVNTHLHFDHCGGNAAFAGIPIIVNRDHFEFARESDSFPSRLFDLPSLTYQFIDGEPELFPGVKVIQTPGHTQWHQSLLISLPNDGDVIICADAIDCQDNLDHDTWGSQLDPEVARENAHKLVHLAEERHAQLWYGHDREQWKTLRLAPDFYS